MCTDETAELVEVAQPRRVEDAAGPEEEHGLERSVADDEQERGDPCDVRGLVLPGVGQEHRETERGDRQPDVLRRRVGKEPLQVTADAGLQDAVRG